VKKRFRQGKREPSGARLSVQVEDGDGKRDATIGKPAPTEVQIGTANKLKVEKNRQSKDAS